MTVAPQRMYRIGELARLSGVTPDALRYYERFGLLPRAPRTTGGFRRYEPHALQRLRFIKQAQAHGFTLSEVRALVSYQDRGGRERRRRVQDLLLRKLKELESKRRQLEEFCRTLEEYLSMCQRALNRGTDVECPVVEELGRTDR